MSSTAQSHVGPPDCLVRVGELASDVELIRHELGHPVEPRPAVTVTGASPRECWFLAVAVFRKAARLSQELAGDPVASVPPTPRLTAVQSVHVLAVIDAAGRELDEVKRALRVTERAEPPRRDPATTPSDVFGAVATLNRQISGLLERPFSPADVFAQVSLAIAYAAQLDGGRPPAPAPFERGKRPADCYDRLGRCLAQVRMLIRAADRAVIDDAPSAGAPESVLPSDVYDLASLVLGEVAFLHAIRAETPPPHPVDSLAPGRKLPSDVWQLAGVLEQQLLALPR